jgi:hypothetical protein
MKVVVVGERLFDGIHQIKERTKVKSR